MSEDLILRVYHLKNTKNEAALQEVQALIAKYGIKATKPESDDITLIRLSISYATISFAVYTALDKSIINYPVTEKEIGLDNSQDFFPNFVPSLLSNVEMKKEIITLLYHY